MCQGIVSLPGLMMRGLLLSPIHLRLFARIRMYRQFVPLSMRKTVAGYTAVFSSTSVALYKVFSSSMGWGYMKSCHLELASLASLQLEKNICEVALQ